MVGLTKEIKGPVRENDRGEIIQQEGAKRDREGEREGREGERGRGRGERGRERERDMHIDRYSTAYD